MRLYTSIIIVLSTILFSCNREGNNEVINSSLPSLLRTKGYIVPPDSILPADTTFIKNPTGFNVKKMPAVAMTTNQSNIPLSLKISRMSTTTRVIGEGETTIPNSFEFSEKHQIAGTPEQVLVKEPLYKEINPGSFFYFNKMQGLLHDQIRALVQDSIGNIWIGTDRGLSRYDGKFFYHFTDREGLPVSIINALFIDSHNNLWISTYDGGVTRYDGNFFTTITTEEGLPHNLVNCIFEDKHGDIWFGTRKGLVKYEPGKLTVFTIENGLSANDVRSIIEDGSGRMWIATYGGGISIYDGVSFSTFSSKEGLIQDHISLLFIDSKNNIWISTAFKGIIKYDGRALTTYTTREGLGNNSIRSILEDKDGNMWFGNSNGNLTKFDGISMRVYGKSDGLVAEAIRSSLQDKNGNLWFGTRGAGLVRFEGRLFTHYTSQEGLTSSRISHISVDLDEKIWLGTYGGGVNILSEKTEKGIKRQYITPFFQSEGNKDKFVYNTLIDNSGNLWIATDNGGLTKYDGKKAFKYDKNTGLADNMILNVYNDNRNNIWFSTVRDGLYMMKGNSVLNYSKKTGLSSNHIRSFLQDSRNNYWIGTAGGGLTKYDGKNFIHFNKKNGFFTDTINSIIEDNRGIIWLASNGEGVIRHDGESFIRYSEESGLKSKFAMSIFQDSKGNIWIGTRFGLHEIKKRVHENIDSTNRGISINSYGIEDGFAGMECRKGAIAESSNGTIWIGTEDRLTAYHGGNTYSAEYTPSLQITKLKVFNEDVPWEKIFKSPDTTLTLANGEKVIGAKMSNISKWYSLPQDLVLKHKNNYLTIHFIATTHTQMKSIRYRYILEGFDKNWSSLTDKTEATYANLKKGKYTFRVKAITGDGIESDESTYTFTIKPAWWGTLFFQLILIFTIIALLFKYCEWKTKNIKAKAQLLKQEVDDFKSELRREELAKNIAINERDKLFSIITHDLRSAVNSDKTEGPVNTVNTLIDNVLQWSRIEQNNIQFNPERIKIQEALKEELDTLSQISNAKEIYLNNKIPIKLEVDADPKLLRIVIRNLITNAIKFTPRRGDITIKGSGRKPDKIEISVEDTGIGMSEEMRNKLFTLNLENGRYGTEGEPGTGLGLMICHYLVTKHSGEINVESEAKSGSRFIITLPKNQEEL